MVAYNNRGREGDLKMVIRNILPPAAALVLAFSGATGTVAKTKNAGAAVPQPISASEKSDGAKVHPEILKEFGGAWQSPQTDYVVRVGKNIAIQSGLGNAESDFTVTLLNSPVNNAFAIPGGYIYITRQLVALCNSEAEMAGVLGHEVGHVAARHSKSRAKRTTIANILGAVGTIGGALLGDNGGLIGMLGSGLKQYSGTLAQVLTLKYSRGQEEGADDLGIRYLSKAGYDPTALSDMLNSLAMQTSVDSRVAGQGERSIPEWASTHPDPAKRVVRAAANAKAFPANTNRKQDTHFAAINGILYDDDPKEGVIEGQEFLHPDSRFKFAVPTGFGMQNSSEAVVINGTSGKGLFTTAAYTGNKQAYIDAAFAAVAGKDQAGNPQRIIVSAITQTTINGIPAFFATALVPTQTGTQNELTVYAYEFAADTAYHFVTIAPVNTSPFTAMYQSMARLTQAQAASIKPRKIKIISVAKNDTIATLSAKMAYTSMQTDRFLALNGLRSNAALKVGSKVKIVTY
jgi:predicted Zn-dependent protease